ncbi:MAG: hypothetical protein ACRC6E_01710 [Fusobacteriaceae bacterium]
MRDEIRFELFITEKFVMDYAYASNLTDEEKMEVALYRAELVRMLTISDLAKVVRPPRPSIFDRYN